MAGRAFAGSLIRKSGQPQLIGTSRQIVELREEISRVARSDAKILVTGESGVGKEVVAQCIHVESPRSNVNFTASRGRPTVRTDFVKKVEAVFNRSDFDPLLVFAGPAKVAERNDDSSVDPRFKNRPMDSRFVDEAITSLTYDIRFSL